MDFLFNDGWSNEDKQHFVPFGHTLIHGLSQKPWLLIDVELHFKDE